MSTRTDGRIIVTVAVSGGLAENVTAAPVDIADLRGMFCVHPRRAEAQQAATVMMGWVVTHIASGRAVAYGYTKAGAIEEAEATIRRVGRSAFRALALKHVTTMKRQLRRRDQRLPKQAALFADRVKVAA